MHVHLGGGGREATPQRTAKPHAARLRAPHHVGGGEHVLVPDEHAAVQLATGVQAAHTGPGRVGRRVLRAGATGQGLRDRRKKNTGGQPSGHQQATAAPFTHGDATDGRSPHLTIHSDHANTPVQRDWKEHSTTRTRRIRVRGWCA
ncbi:hypothetical protein D9M68_823230 [compost metagenome]